MRSRYVLKELKIEVTRKCPLWCIHCSSNGEPNAPEALDPARLIRLITEFADMGGERIAISGGEPLGYEELPTILRTCRALGLQTQVYTTGIASRNGSLNPVSERLIEIVAHNDAILVFSLHGACSVTHDLLTQVKGSFKATMTAIERTSRVGVPVEVHVVPTALNLRELADLAKMVTDTSVRKVSWLRFVPQGRGEAHRSILELTKQQLWQLAETKAQLERVWPSAAVRAGAPFNILCPDTPTPCVAGLSQLVVRSDGRVVPCDAFKQFPTGESFSNILTHSLAEVWTKSDLLAKLRLVQETRANSPCASCEFYAQCRSGCLGQKAVAAQRVVDGKDPDCLLNFAMASHGRVKAAAVC